MPTQPTLRRALPLRTNRRQHLTHRSSFPTVGQSFDIEISRDTDGWTIRIPEISRVAHARRRATVELAARECIAKRTGIPIGYVTTFVTKETVGA